MPKIHEPKWTEQKAKRTKKKLVEKKEKKINKHMKLVWTQSRVHQHSHAYANTSHSHALKSPSVAVRMYFFLAFQSTKKLKKCSKSYHLVFKLIESLFFDKFLV